MRLPSDVAETGLLVDINRIGVHDSLMGQKRQSHINSPMGDENWTLVTACASLC